MQNLDFNVPHGILTFGLGIVESVAVLKGRELRDDENFKVALLGWCIESVASRLIFASSSSVDVCPPQFRSLFIVSDDIMDYSITRRGKPYWYRIRGVGNIAINDAFMLEGAIYR